MPSTVRIDVLRKLLRAGARSRVERLIDRLQPPDIAELLPELTPREVREIIEILFSVRRAGRTLSELPAEVLPGVLEAISNERMTGILARLEPDDAVLLLDAVADERREILENDLSLRQRTEINRIRAYPEATAGSVMTTRFLALKVSMTAEEAIGSIRRHTEEEVEQVFYLYVTDDEDRLEGVVPIRRLVTCPPATPLRELMIPDTVAVDAHEDQERVAAVVAKYNLLAVPVIDAERRLIGVITVDDVIDVIHEEATEDMFRMVGLSEGEHVFSPVLTSFRRRLPWMVVNLGTAFLAAWVVGLFESSIRSVVALAVFLPVVAGMGGNGGTQTLTIITRGMALGELGMGAGLRAIRREVGIGLGIGVTVGALTALAAWAWRGSPVLGLVLLLAMVCNMTVAGLAGAGVPLLLRSLGQDPALGSGVIVTTFTDVFGFLSFLGIATLFLAYLV